MSVGQVDDDTRLQASEAIRLYGRHASAVCSQQADSLFLEGDLLGAFYYRLIVFAIEEMEEHGRHA